MAERYGARSPRTRWLSVAALALLVAALLAWLLWAAWVHATTSVSGEVISFHVAGQHRIDVTVQIARPGGTAAQCTIQAQAVDHSLVGETVVSVSADSGADAQIKASIKTDREATTATVSECH